jgi:hypothetical protein
MGPEDAHDLRADFVTMIKVDEEKIPFPEISSLDDDSFKRCGKYPWRPRFGPRLLTCLERP